MQDSSEIVWRRVISICPRRDCELRVVQNLTCTGLLFSLAGSDMTKDLEPQADGNLRQKIGRHDIFLGVRVYAMGGAQTMRAPTCCGHVPKGPHLSHQQLFPGCREHCET